MRYLAESPNGACSLARLASSLALDPAYIRQEIEPFLFHQGLVDATGSRGRELTKAGHAIVAELDAAQASEQDEEVAI
jgi:Holliday junction resolvasome RuvABC ATP-dependent DNA helicase subunit